MALSQSAPAKVNLFLRVLGRRADGYHELRTCIHALAFGDELRAERGGAGVELEVRSAASLGLEVPAGPENLVHRAAVAFAAASGVRVDVRFTLDKRIPAGAGLGGGSSDAAAALRILNRLFDAPLDAAQLHAIARGLGADVPFFLDGGTQIGTGIGDCLTPVPHAPHYHFVLLLPPYGIPTAEVYRRSGAPRLTRGDDSTKKGGAVACPEELLVPERFVNDLEAAAMAVEPRLAALHERVAERFPRLRMSGSGSALFLAFAEAGAATAARHALERLRDEGIAIVQTESTGAIGPPPQHRKFDEGDGC